MQLGLLALGAVERRRDFLPRPVGTRVTHLSLSSANWRTTWLYMRASGNTHSSREEGRVAREAPLGAIWFSREWPACVGGYRSEQPPRCRFLQGVGGPLWARSPLLLARPARVGRCWASCCEPRPLGCFLLRHRRWPRRSVRDRFRLKQGFGVRCIVQVQLQLLSCRPR